MPHGQGSGFGSCFRRNSTSTEDSFTLRCMDASTLWKSIQDLYSLFELAVAKATAAAQSTAGSAVTVQVGGSVAAVSVKLDSAVFSLPAGMTKVKVDAFISLQPTNAGEQVNYSLLFDGSAVLPSGGGGASTLGASGQTGTVVGAASVGQSLHTIIAPPDHLPHTYSIQATSAHNLQIGDGAAAVVLVPLP